MERSENNVPEIEKSDGKTKKKRTQAQKVGTNKLILRKVDRIEGRQERIEGMLRLLFQGLSYELKYDGPVIETVCCSNELDLAVVSSVFESGGGILAKRIVEQLNAQFPQERFERHKIQRIINRVNQNCQDAYGRVLIEKRGKRWAFTAFGFEVWGKTKKDLEAEVQQPAAASPTESEEE